MPRFSTRHRQRQLCSVLLALALATAGAARAEPPAPPSGPEILQEMKAFASMGSVLMIAAHPDDEDTALITYLARGRNYRMAYLSVNRGDGGQNVLGGEFGPELGYIRTNELLAARNLDHGVQFFTRAIDFGYSKSPEETLRIWDHQKVLDDVVRVIRTFRPDVIVTRFSPETQPGQHGHHTASAILGIEAFKVANDPKVLPGMPVWQPLRIMQDASGPAGRGGAGAAASAVRINIGGTDPVLNETYGAIAQQSRAMHKSQGFGATGGGAGAGGGRGFGGGATQATLTAIDGKPATTDLMDGVDTTWARVKGGEEIAKKLDTAIAAFDMNNPEASVPALLEIKKLLAALPATPIDLVVEEKRGKLDRLIADCLGLSVEVTTPQADVVPNTPVPLHFAASLKGKTPVLWTGIARSGLFPVDLLQQTIQLQTGKTSTSEATEINRLSIYQPYWLREPGADGIYTVSDQNLIGKPMNPPEMVFHPTFQVGGQTLELPVTPVELIPNAPPAQARRPIAGIAPVSVAFTSDVRLFARSAGSAAKTVEVEVTAHTASATGSVHLKVPTGWSTQPSSQDFSLAAAGEHKTFTFAVSEGTKPGGVGTLQFNGWVVPIGAAVEVAGRTYDTGWKEIKYDHLPRLLLQPRATTTLVMMNLQIKGKTVGYLPGAGDSVAEAIRQMGYTVTELKPTDLTADGLRNFDAVVLGVRAFNVRADLGPNSPGLQALFDYANAGGTVVEQYNRPDGPGGADSRPTRLAPFNIHVTALRVTDETAKVTFLAPDNPVLNTPNKITDEDFANWVQERNIYLPDTVDPHFTPILAMSDPGESPPQTSLLIADTGKGHWIYTSLVFFRELPAGNPGAYRLFANLISLGKP